jgi:pimeloyl-ACP methyl ester carboxylesterase
MDDGVEIATTLLTPDGAPPDGGWPAVMVFHGLGQTRQPYNPLAETTFVPQGYAVLTFDARGHGESGGLVTLDGPREIADARTLLERLRARPDVADARVGAWGLSYGGGAILRLLGEGAPFGAAVAHETWTDLFDALFPQSLAKSGAVFGFAREIAPGRSPFVEGIRDDALASRNLEGLRTISRERSSRHLLGRVNVPTFLLQGRRDFAFDMRQAIEGYTRLGGPKRLYLGNLGHAPSSFLADDYAYFVEQGRLWFDRWLKGVPNGIDTRPPVELAPTPFAESRVGRYRGLPPVKSVSFEFNGRKTLGASAFLQRSSVRTRTPLETFGSPVVRVEASGTYPHLVAVLKAITPDGREITVSEGGARIDATPRRVVRISMISQATAIPRGSRLLLRLGPTSGDLLYITTVPSGSRIQLGRATLTLPVLRTPVSR